MNTISKIHAPDPTIAIVQLDFSKCIWIELLNTNNVVKLLVQTE